MKSGAFLAILSVFLLVSPAQSLVDNCTVDPEALTWFKYLTFYAWNIQTGNWTNLGQSSALKPLQAFHNMSTGGDVKQGMLELSSVFFQPMQEVNASLKGLTLRQDAYSQWEAQIPAIQAAVDEGAVQGFFLGDELVYSNITWDQLNRTASLVKQTFPSCFLYYNEGGSPLYGGSNINGFHEPYPFVPHSFDFVSSDDYHSIDTQESPRWFYEKYLYPKMSAAQRAFVVPPVFAWLWRANTTVTSWDLQQLEEGHGYIQWIGQDSRIVGVNGFHLASYPPQDLGLSYPLPLTLQCYQALATQLRDAARTHRT